MGRSSASFRCSLRPQGLFRAVYQRLLFGRGEPGCRVHRKIEPGRHVTLFHLRGDVFGVPLGAVPAGEIQMAAAAIDVSLKQPGDWGNVGIPGPQGLVAMAVKAGSVEQCPRGG